MTSPPVSVVIPTRDRPALLRRAVQSVLDQSYSGAIEIVVVFDATDPELPASDVPEGRRLWARRNDRAPGLAGARNTGILAASHEFVAFLDDDDRWHPAKLDRQMVRFEGGAGVLFVGTAMTVDDGERTHERLLPGATVGHRDLLHSRLAGLHASSFVLRRSALLGDLGLIDEDLPGGHCEDYDLLLRAARLAPIEVVNEPLVTVSWRGTSHFLGRWADYSRALRQLLAKHPSFGDSAGALARIQAQIAFAEAASGGRVEGIRWAGRALRHDPRQAKAWLSLAIALRLTSGDRIARVAQRFGRRI